MGPRTADLWGTVLARLQWSCNLSTANGPQGWGCLVPLQGLLREPGPRGRRTDSLVSPSLAQTQVLGPCVSAGLSSWLEDQPRGRLGPRLRNQTPLFLPSPWHRRLQDQERQQAGLNTCSACQPPPAMLLVWSPPASSHLYDLHLHHLHLYCPTCIIPTCMVPTCSIPAQVPTIPIIFTAVGNWAAPPLLRGS